jgi:alpha-1,3-mannosyltransferase
MKIVHVVRQYKPSIGGLEDAVYNLCSVLARNTGISVSIVTLDRCFARPQLRLPSHETVDGIEVRRIPYWGSKRYPIAPAVLDEIRDADVVHVHAIDFFFDYLALTRPIHRKPLVASTHGGFFHTSFASSLKKIYFNSITRLSSKAYYALCSSSSNDTATFQRIAPGKVITVENGVNIHKWKDCAAASPTRTMLYVGRWSENKRLPLLLDLVAALKAESHNWHLIIAGVPAHETVSSLRTRAASLGIEQQLSIYESPSDGDIARLIGQASYIASASAYEGFGISAIEGLSAGLLPILTTIPPFEKLRAALGFSAVIHVADLIRSAHEIETLHASYSHSPASMKEQCMNMAKRYDWPRVADAFVKIYMAALNKDVRPLATLLPQHSP